MPAAWPARTARTGGKHKRPARPAKFRRTRGHRPARRGRADPGGRRAAGAGCPNPQRDPGRVVGWQQRHRDSQETRREIARHLDLDDLAFNPDRFIALLDRLWVLGHPLDPWTQDSGLRAQIHQHVFRNPGDWSTEHLFEQLGAFEAGMPGSGSSWKGWPAPTSSRTSRYSAASPARLTSTCAQPGQSCGKPALMAATRSSALSRPGPVGPASRRTSSSPRLSSPTSGSLTPSTTTSRSPRTPVRSDTTRGEPGGGYRPDADRRATAPCMRPWMSTPCITTSIARTEGRGIDAGLAVMDDVGGPR